MSVIDKLYNQLYNVMKNVIPSRAFTKSVMLNSVCTKRKMRKGVNALQVVEVLFTASVRVCRSEHRYKDM